MRYWKTASRFRSRGSRACRGMPPSAAACCRRGKNSRGERTDSTTEPSSMRSAASSGCSTAQRARTWASPVRRSSTGWRSSSWRISVTVPSARRRPRKSSRMRSVSWAISPRMWLLTRMRTPPSARLRSRAMRVSRASGSRPLKGSSRMSSSGPCIRAWARRMRWRMPLDIRTKGRCARSVMPTVARDWATARVRASPDSPDSSPIMRSQRPARSPVGRRSPSGTRPRRASTAGLRKGASPKMRTSPPEGGSRPESSCSSEDLPAPLGPSRPVMPPPSGSSKVVGLSPRMGP